MEQIKKLLDSVKIYAKNVWVKNVLKTIPFVAISMVALSNCATGKQIIKEYDNNNNLKTEKTLIDNDLDGKIDEERTQNCCY